MEGGEETCNVKYLCKSQSFVGNLILSRGYFHHTGFLVLVRSHLGQILDHFGSLVFFVMIST